MYFMAQMRITPRRGLMCRVTILWENQTHAKPQRLAGLLEDRSSAGIGVSLSRPLPIGVRVTIHGIRGKRGIALELSGVVKYCRREGLGYFAGIQYDEIDAEWSSIRYEG